MLITEFRYPHWSNFNRFKKCKNSRTGPRLVKVKTQCDTDINNTRQKCFMTLDLVSLTLVDFPSGYWATQFQIQVLFLNSAKIGKAWTFCKQTRSLTICTWIASGKYGSSTVLILLHFYNEKTYIFEPIIFSYCCNFIKIIIFYK